MKKNGFTLAELLITLAVIGIVASMVIPTLIQTIDDSKYKTAWKKAYSNLSQATLNVLRENGSFKDLCNDWSSTCLKNKYLNAFSYLKEANSGQGAGNCWHAAGDFRYLDNDPVNDWGDSSCMALNNGTLLFFAYASKSCTYTSAGWLGTNRCGWIYLDTNGFAPPNTVGKDILGAALTEDKLIPLGGSSESVLNTCETTGVGCGAKFLFSN